MKKLFCFLVVFYSLSLMAQQTDDKENILKGKILQHSFKLNAKEFPPIAEVEIKAGFASPTLSLSNGDYELVFHKMQAGEAVTLNVYKDSYEVVNEDDLNTKVPKHSNEQLLKIYLAPRGKIDEHKIAYYNISLEIITGVYERQITALNKQQEGWEEELSRIEEEYQRQLKHARKLAEKFARTIFADVGELYKKAFSLYQEGNIDEALKKLNETNLIDRANQRILERNRIDSLNNVLVEDRVANEKGIKEDMEAIKLAIELHAIKYEYEDAETLFEKLWLLDTTNMENTFNYADFLNYRNQYDQALYYYHKVLQSSDAEQWLKFIANYHIGNISRNKGDMDQAIEAFTEVMYKYKTLSEEEKEIDFYSIIKSNSYIGMGMIYEEKGDYDKALEYLNAGLKTNENVAETSQVSEFSKIGSGLIYTTLGYVSMEGGDLGSALEYFNLGGNIFEELPKYDSGDTLDFILPAFYLEFGRFYKNQGNYDKALEYLNKSNKLYNDINNSNLQNIVEKTGGLALSSLILGELYYFKGNMKEASEYLTISNDLLKKMYEKVPLHELLKRSFAISNKSLGEIAIFNGNIDTSLSYFKTYNKLSTELERDNPNSIYNKLNVASSYWKLGQIYHLKMDSEKALENDTLFYKLSKELYEEHPYLDKIKHQYAISCGKLGDVYQSQQNYDKALEYYMLYNKLLKELFTLNPYDQLTKNNYAKSLWKIGQVYQAQGDTIQAFVNFNEQKKLNEELYEVNDKNVEFIKGLANAYWSLGYLYTKQDSLDKALNIYKQKKELLELHNSTNFSDNEEIKNQLAWSYIHMGGVHRKLSDNYNAERLIKQASELFLELYENESVYEKKENGLLTSYLSLGYLYWKSDCDKAIEYFTSAFKLVEITNLVNLQGKEIKLKINECLRGLTLCYFAKENKEKTIEYSDICLKFLNELYAENSQSEELKESMILASLEIGSICIQQSRYDVAKDFFVLTKKLTEELFDTNPNVELVQNQMLSSYMFLCQCFEAQGDTKMWFEYATNWNDRAKKLYEAYPQNSYLQWMLGMSYASFADINILYKKEDIAMKYYKNAAEIFKELSMKTGDPSYIGYKFEVDKKMSELNKTKQE